MGDFELVLRKQAKRLEDDGHEEASEMLLHLNSALAASEGDAAK